MQTTATKLPLDTWARMMGIQPIHFNGVVLDGTGDSPNLQAKCGQAWFQESWQDHDRVSREEVARAIAQAEADIEAQVGYRLLPSWEADELIQTTRPFHPGFVNLTATDVRGFPSTVTVRWKLLIAPGRKALTLIDDAAAIVWSDEDGDGYEETGTVTVTTTVTDPSEVSIFYPGKDGEEQWRIRPIRVFLASGTATITFRRELAIAEEFIEALPDLGDEGAGEMPLPNGAVDNDFLATVDVYRVWNDPSDQATFLWAPGTGCACNADEGCAICSNTEQTGCLSVRDPRLGLLAFRPATWDEDEEAFVPATWTMQRMPDTLRVSYRAGLRDMSLRDPINEMDRFWAYTVAMYAASMLDRNPCDCAANQFEQWREDLSHISGDGQTDRYRVSQNDLESCPFGTRRGAVLAWRRIQQRPGSKVAMGGVFA